LSWSPYCFDSGGLVQANKRIGQRLPPRALVRARQAPRSINVLAKFGEEYVSADINNYQFKSGWLNNSDIYKFGGRYFHVGPRQ
jgi:hypothetical protein